MEANDWLLFLHVLAGFALVASAVIFTTLIVVTRRAEAGAPVLRLSWLGSRLWDVGGLGTLVFGIWLALDRDRYDILDGWILAALVLWVIAAGAGARVGTTYREAREAGDGGLAVLRDQGAVLLQVVMVVATLALLVDMIYKPGA